MTPAWPTQKVEWLRIAYGLMDEQEATKSEIFFFFFLTGGELSAITQEGI